MARAVVEGLEPEVLAEYEQAVELVQTHSVPVYAQWEVAEHLTSAGVADVQSIAPLVDADGQEQYLSTAGVAEQAVVSAAAEGRDLGTVGVFCFSDHAARCVETGRSAGMEAGAPEGVDLPSTYDPASGQPWTRDRVSYVTADLASRFAGA